MEDIKNEFYLTLKEDSKKDFEILFQDKENFDLSKIEEFNEKLKKFIELQINIYEYIAETTDKNNQKNIFSVVIKDGKDLIDLSFVCFHEQYDFTDKNSSLNKILKDLNILNYSGNKDKNSSLNKILKDLNILDYSGNKEYAMINKAFNFGNAIFYKRVEFIRVVFKKQMNFEGATFEGDINFEKSKFIFENKTDNAIEVSFEGIICKKEAIFNSVEFLHEVSFFRARFYDYTSFHKTKFHNEVSFENAVSKDLFYFHDVSIGKLDLIGFHYEKANFLILTNIDKSAPILTKANFKNKDTARIIKAHFEQQNNTTETNDYFIIEQEFYIELLHKDNTSYSNKTINIISLWFNKYVSNYGTDWVRVLIVIFGFGFLASLGYSFFDYCPSIISSEICKKYFINLSIDEKWILWLEFSYAYMLYIVYYDKENFFFWTMIIIYIIILFFSTYIQDINNKVIALVNPLNIFNQDMVFIVKNNVLKNINYFENIAWYGVFVKVVTVSLIYQFIISFRNSTRRK